MEGSRADTTRAPGPWDRSSARDLAIQPFLSPAEGLSRTNRELRPAPTAPAAHGSTAAGPERSRHRRRGRAAPPAVTSPRHPGGGKAEPITRAQGCGMASRRNNRLPYP
jgi:hypothetical protein